MYSTHQLTEKEVLGKNCHLVGFIGRFKRASMIVATFDSSKISIVQDMNKRNALTHQRMLKASFESDPDTMDIAGSLVELANLIK